MREDLVRWRVYRQVGNDVKLTGPDNTTITASDRSIIEWSQFDIGLGHTVEFVQPSTSAWVLNRDRSGDASLIDRPDWQADDAAEQFHEYMYLRDNPAGEHRELWFHEQGDRSWLVVTRNTVTHEILNVELARDVARARGRSK